ncbi:MAG: DUF2092 domain-containing protein [Phycisphaerales bacterium]|nr:MAG: DUF2092 domain-containing protein [Phycisphaerales bacterium]
MHTRQGWIGVAAVFALAGSATGQTPVPGDNIEPRARQIFTQMGTYLVGAKQFSFRSRDMMDEVLESGMKIQLGTTKRIAVRRPDRITAQLVGDGLNERLWYDGRTLSIHNRDENSYAVLEVPDNIDQMIDYVARTFGVVMPLADLLFSDLHESTLKDVWFGFYVGLHDVLGAPCHHLAFRQNAVDWQIWIEAGDKPLPRKLVITYKSVPGQPEFIAFLDEWNFSPELPDEVFIFAPPAGATKIDMQAIMEQPRLGSDGNAGERQQGSPSEE